MEFKANKDNIEELLSNKLKKEEKEFKKNDNRMEKNLQILKDRF